MNIYRFCTPERNDILVLAERDRTGRADAGAHRLEAFARAVETHVAFHLQMHLGVVFRHAERTRVDTVAAIETAWFERRHHDSVFVLFDRVGRAHERTGRLDAVHAHGRHRRCRLGSVDVVDKDHRITFVRRTLAARGHARAAADAALRVDEHCLLHLLSPLTSLKLAPFAALAEQRQLTRMDLLDACGAGFVFRNFRCGIERRIGQLVDRQLLAPVIRNKDRVRAGWS